MNLRHIEYLITAAEYGSYTMAAKALFVSEPSLWKAIKDIEREFGVTIFEKGPRSLIVTAEGQEFIFYAKKLLDQSKFIEKFYDRRRLSGSTAFFVASQHYHFAVTAFSRLLLELGERYYVGIREGETQEILADVSLGMCDLGIIYISEPNEKSMMSELKSRDLEFLPLRQVTPCAYLSVNSPLAQQKEIDIKDLEGKAFVQYEQRNATLRFYSEEVLDELPFEKKVYIRDRGTMEDVIAENPLSFGIGTGALIATSRIKLVTIPLREHTKMNLGWIKNAQKPLNEIGKRYLELLRIAITEEFDQTLCQEIKQAD